MTAPQGLTKPEICGERRGPVRTGLPLPDAPYVYVGGLPSRVLDRVLGAQDYPQEWFIRGLLPKGAFFLVAGDPKLGRKTLTLMECKQAIAVGRPFLGFETVRSPTIYSYLEDDPREISRRIRGLGQMPELLTEPYPNATSTFGIAECWWNLHWISKLGMAQPGVWFIDTFSYLRAMHGFDEENDAAQMHDLIGAYIQFCRYTGWTIVCAHHMRKDGTEIRGSSALKTTADGWWQVHHTAGRTARRVATEGKQLRGIAFDIAFEVEGTLERPTFRVSGGVASAADSEQRDDGNGNGRRTGGGKAARAGGWCTDDEAIRRTARAVLTERGDDPGLGRLTDTALQAEVARRLHARVQPKRWTAVFNAMRDDHEVVWDSTAGVSWGAALRRWDQTMDDTSGDLSK